MAAPAWSLRELLPARAPPAEQGLGPEMAFVLHVRHVPDFQSEDHAGKSRVVFFILSIIISS